MQEISLEARRNNGTIRALQAGMTMRTLSSCKARKLTSSSMDKVLKTWPSITQSILIPSNALQLKSRLAYQCNILTMRWGSDPSLSRPLFLALLHNWFDFTHETINRSCSISSLFLTHMCKAYGASFCFSVCMCVNKEWGGKRTRVWKHNMDRCVTIGSKLGFITEIKEDLNLSGS